MRCGLTTVDAHVTRLLAFYIYHIACATPFPDEAGAARDALAAFWVCGPPCAAVLRDMGAMLHGLRLGEHVADIGREWRRHASMDACAAEALEYSTALVFGKVNVMLSWSLSLIVGCFC